MQIDKGNIIPFYLGTAAEYYICSEFFTFECEAFITNPDIGYDIISTNTAMKKYYEEEDKIFKVQVKSTLLKEDDKLARFYIKNDDFELLISDKNSILVCVFQIPIKGIDPASMCDHDGHSQTQTAIDKMLSDGYYDNFSNDIRRLGDFAQSQEIDGFRKEYIWLNRNHLKKMLEDGFISEVDIKGNKLKQLCITVENDSWELKSDKGDTSYLAPELFSIKYLVKSHVKSREELDEGYYNPHDAY